MKNLFRHLMGAKPSAASAAAPSSLPAPDAPATIEDGSDNAIRRQLVQMLMRDALRTHGIPAGWIECQMLLVASQSRGPGMYIRLVIKHWDERLLKYAFAFQCALLADIARFEPHAPDWLHGMSWQLDVESTCPYPDMPPPDYWAPINAALPVVPEVPPSFAATMPPDFDLSEQPIGSPVIQGKRARRERLPEPAPKPLSEEDEALSDLEQLFKIRDRELGLDGTMPVGGHPPVGYEKTQPMRL